MAKYQIVLRDGTIEEVEGGHVEWEEQTTVVFEKRDSASYLLIKQSRFSSDVIFTAPKELVQSVKVLPEATEASD